MKLFECHAHLALDGITSGRLRSSDTPETREKYVNDILDAYCKAGVTYIRDGGDKWGIASLCAKKAKEYGIIIKTPAYPIYKNGNYGKFLGLGYSSIADYLTLVEKAVLQGADFIKIMASGIMDFSEFGKLTGFSLSKAELTEIIRIAHDKGLSVMVHVNGNEGVINAAEAGADSIEHAYFADANAHDAMRENGCVWVPTLAPVANLSGRGMFDDGIIRDIVELQKQRIREETVKKALIAPGSDCGASCVLHPYGIADEYSLFEKTLGKNKSEKLLTEGAKAIMAMF